jgi:hypothetical protein
VRGRSWRRHIGFLRQAALALGFSDISHGAVEIRVRTVLGIPDNTVHDKRDFVLQCRDLLVAVDEFVFDAGAGFRDRNFRVERVLQRRFEIGVASDTSELNGGRELRPRSVDLLGFNDDWIDGDSPPS